MLNEASIISTLQKHFPTHIGDDAAVIPYSKDRRYVITKDLLIEDIHFRTRYTSPVHLAHKALHANLSDIAAMGAQPRYILLGIAVPITYQTQITSFLTHFTRACKAASVVLIGGDTVKSLDKLCISITVIGLVKTQHIKYRQTAKPGDLICQLGEAGHAHIGLMALEADCNGFSSFKNKFLKPQAHIEEGLWLGAQTGVTSMMDISDGLLIDLKRLCASSSVAAEIHLEQLIGTKSFKLACKRLQLDPLEATLTGGEDYNLLFTVIPDEYTSLAKKFHKQFDEKFKYIGKIKRGMGVSVTKNNQLQPLHLTPFSHFGELS